MFLSVITKNLNWEILTSIWLLLKDGMGSKMENFNIVWLHWKIPKCGGFMKKKTIYRRNCLKMGLG